MNKKQKDHYFAECPFYKKDGGLEIRCEGIDETSRLLQQFRTKTDKANYMSSYCCTQFYCACRIYTMLDEKYDETGKLVD